MKNWKPWQLTFWRIALTAITAGVVILLCSALGGCAVDARGFGGWTFGGADGGAFTRGKGGEGDEGVGGAGGAPVVVVVGTSGTGGAVSTGGVTATGGVLGTGGALGIGGTAGTGGVTVTGGTGGMAVPNCADAAQPGPVGTLPHPGPVCSSCHKFTAAGTVYGDGYDPVNCLGINGDAVGGVQVLIYGADLKTRTLPVDSSGNFWTDEVIPFPATVSVVRDKQKRMMVDSLLSGDCNSCHEAIGKPGRVVTP